MNKFDYQLDRRPANHQPLTPLTFLDRAADVFPNRTAVIDKDRRFTWQEYASRCRQLGRALIGQGVQRGDTVSIISTNSPAMLEAQFGVPLAGAVLNTINIRLDGDTVAYILEHSEAKALLVERQFLELAKTAVRASGLDIFIVEIDDKGEQAQSEPLGAVEYEAFLADAPDNIELRYPTDEWDAISLNYTSGTTGRPKGVVYHHRGAYLNALGQIFNANLLGKVPVYLWTLPLFHCNGWCFPWALAAVGATQVCLSKVSASDIYQAIESHAVTHFCCAPTVLGFLIDGKPPTWNIPEEPINVVCAGASPPASILEKVEQLGFSPIHVYGMTEFHGITTLCQPQSEWQQLEPQVRLGHLGHQGVRTIVMDEMQVCRIGGYEPVPKDGKTMGEVLFRGNLGMKGYLKNPSATNEAFADDWYHTGDLAVVHDNGYIEIKDRSKDIIISGGENISSLEIESVIYQYPGVTGVAVVAVKDDKWGEVPCALVEFSPDVDHPANDTMTAFCREKLPGFKVPKHFVFEPLTRTATGKLQKFKLRAHAETIVSARLSQS
jgi:fatty-acyl-CoA synthase